MNNVFISIIIPVFNDSTRLEKCLDAISKQTYLGSDFEVIVVDNGSTEDIKALVNSYENAIFLVEEKPGSYAARNKGISAAKGNLFAFTDADCIPDLHWLECGVDMLLAHPDSGLIAGQINLFFRKSEPNSVELYESIEMGFDQQALLKFQHYALTANLFTQRQVFEQVGTFNEDLKSGGDREWGQRVHQAGFDLIFAPMASVGHPARSSYWQLYKRVTRINGGKFDSSIASLPFIARVKLFFRDFGLAVTPPFRSLIKVFTEDEKGLGTLEKKLKFTSIMLLVRYVSAWERLRLHLGGKSRRW